MTCRKRQSGFSLLEVMLVVCLLALIAVMAAPRYANSLSYYRADLSAKRVAADLQMARSNAWAAGAGRTAVFNVTGESYVIGSVRGLDQATTDYTVNLGTDPYNALIDTVNFEGTATVTFDGYGMPNRGGTVIIRAGSYQRTITLDKASGNVSVQ